MTGGFGKTEMFFGKLLSDMMQMSALYFFNQVQVQEKIAKIDDIIDFAVKSFEIRTYRQIIKAFRMNVSSLVGFKHCFVLFNN